MVLQTPLEPAAGRKHFVLFSLWKCFQEDALESGKEPLSSSTASCTAGQQLPVDSRRGCAALCEEEAGISGVSSSQCWSTTNLQ